MILPTELAGSAFVLGRGEAEQFQKDIFSRAVLNTVRYADPAAWVTATAVARAIAPIHEQVAAVKDRVGVVVTSAEGPVDAQAAVAEAARSGFPSPLRYPAANPGSMAGVSCIAFGFRGPTLNLLHAPGEGVPVSLFMASRWLQRGLAALVIVAACTRRATGQHLARALLLASPDACAGQASFDRNDAVAWLISTANDMKSEGI